MGLGDAAAGPPGVAVQVSPRGSMVARALRAVQMPWTARGRVLLLLDPDTVPSALLVRRLRGRAVVADVHEDYVALLHDRSWAPALVRGLLTWLTARCVGLAGRADVTVVADDHVPPAEGATRRRLVVRNLPDLSMLPDMSRPDLSARRAAAMSGERPWRALYVGDLRASRGLDDMLLAVAAAPGWHLDLVGPVSPAERERVEALVGPELDGRVVWHGRLPPRQAWELAAGAAVGLVLLHDTPAFRDSIPTKVYEYLACGLAVLATPLPRVAQLLADSGGGRTVHGAEQAAEILRGWSGDHEAELVAHRAQGLRWALAELDGPSPYARLAAEVNDIIGRHT
jgi:glycosyltransferase involved in cell wall biosynthesis